MDSDIFSYKEIFSILIFILAIIMVTEKSSPSYAVPPIDNQVNSGLIYGDDNAFSNLGRSSPSYAVPLTDNQLNSGHIYAVPPTDNQLNSGHIYGDDNAFSNLSRNMTLFAGSGNITSPTNSIGPNFTVGNINRDNNFGYFGPDGMGGYDIRSGPLFAQHGTSNWWPHIWMHHFH